MKNFIQSILMGLGTICLFFMILFVVMAHSVGKTFQGGIKGMDMGSFETKLKPGSNIGFINIEGEIMESNPTIKRIKTLEESKDIKGVVVNINSPGGAVAPSQRIFEALMKLREKKTVIASIETLGASGGYYIASAAEKIFAYGGSLTGSVGVIMSFANLSKLFEWAKIEPYNITSGKFKDTGSPNRKMTKEEMDYMTGLIVDVKEQFVRDISRGRKMDKEKILPYADGRVMTGEQAKALGFIDQVGTQQDAIDYVAKLNGIKDVNIDDGIDHRKEFFEEIFGSVVDSIKLKVSSVPLMLLYKMGEAR